MIAFLGMGLLGSNFVRNLRERGIAVQVYNRTKAKAEALSAVGATVCETPADAVRGAFRVHLTLSDDAAVDAVLDAAAPGLAPGAIIVDHTTTSANGAAARVARWAERGFSYLHAPVFMGPRNARYATGTMLAAGDRALFDQVEAELTPMTGELVYVGARPDKAAALKLLGNQMIITLTAMLGDSVALADAHDLSPDDVRELLGWFNPGNSLRDRLSRVVSTDYDQPSWELSMARKDARLMREATAKPMRLLDAVIARMDKMLEAGHGARDYTIIAQDQIG